MAYESYESFESVKTRLDEIVNAVSDDELPLDEALSLYEEAVGLGLRASDLLEEGIDEQTAAEALAADEAAGETAVAPTPTDQGAPQAEYFAASSAAQEYASTNDSLEAAAEPVHSDN